LSAEPLPPDHDDEPSLEPPQRSRRRIRIIGRIVGSVFIIVAGALAGFVLLLQNHSIRQYLLRIALPRISRRLNTEVRIRDFSLQLSFMTPSLNMYDIVVDSAPPQQMPLLHVDHLRIGLQIASILQRHWYLNAVAIDHPVVRIFMDTDGNTNLPGPGTPVPVGRIFDLAIAHVLLQQGEIYYNDHRNVLDATLRNFEFQSRFDTAPKRYSGRLSYRDGQINFRNLKPIAHSLESEFQATPETFNLTHCRLNAGASQIDLTATLNDYAHPTVTGTYQASLDSVEVGQILQNSTMPAGVVRLVGSAHFQSDPNKSVLETLSLDGNVNSSKLQVRTTTINTELRDLSAEYLLHRGELDVRNLQAHVLGGSLVGAYTLHDLAATQQSELHAALSNVTLSEIQNLTHPSTRRQFQLSGTAHLTLDATWHNVFDAFLGQATASLKGNLTPTEASNSFPVIPVEGNIHVGYSVAAAELTFLESYLLMPQTRIELTGTVSRHQSLQVQGQSNELHEIEAVANALGLIPEPIDLYGTASFRGTVRGSTTEPQVTGQLSSRSLNIKGTMWRNLRADLDANSSRLALHNLNVQTPDNSGRIMLDASVGLNRWSYTSLSPFEIDLNATELNISDLMSMAGSKAPITGMLSARLSLRGSKDTLAGQGTVTLTRAEVAGEPLQLLSLNFQGYGNEVHAHLDAYSPAGRVQGDVTYSPQRKAYDGQVQTTNINLGQLQTFRTRNIQITGALNLTAKGSGTLDDPGLDLVAGVQGLQIQNHSLSGISIRANIAHHAGNITLDSAAFEGRGKVELTGAYFTEATIATKTISLAPLLAMYFPANAANLSGHTELEATMKGPLKNPSAIDGQITLPNLSLAYRDKIQLAAAQPVHLGYKQGVLTLQRTEIRGTNTDLRMEGSFPVAGTGSISFSVAGNAGLQLVEIINPDLTSSGQIEFNINGYGRRTDPTIKGQIRIVDASFAGSGVPVGLQKGNGILNLAGDRLDIDDFHGNVSSGTFKVRGYIRYRTPAQLNLVMAAAGIRLSYPPGVRTGIDTDLTLTGPLQSPTLSGQVRLNELSFSQALDVNDVLSNFVGTKRALPNSTVRNLKLNLAVQSTGELNPATNQLKLNGKANLQVRGTVAEPAILGSISLTGGEILVRGDRYIIKPSTLEFVNPAVIEPRLNLAVETKVQHYEIRLLLRGPIDQLQTTYSSEPPLPPADIINLLVFGKTDQPLTTLLTDNLGAVSFLASHVTNTITSRIERVVGISQLSIDPVLDHDRHNSTVGVTIRQHVSSNLVVQFTSDPSSTERQVIEVEYQATPRVGVNGVINQNGGFAADIRIRKTW
jgi:translocation and assembly module TamB